MPSTKVREIAAMLKAIHAGEDIVAARQKAVQVIEKMRGLRLANAAEPVASAVEETLAYYDFPEEHWRRIRTTDVFDKHFSESQVMIWSSCPGDRVAKSGVEVESPAAQPLRAPHFFCGTRTPCWWLLLPSRDEAAIARFC